MHSTVWWVPATAQVKGLCWPSACRQGHRVSFMLSGLQDMSAWAGQQQLAAYAQSALINCGAYNGQPLFVIRHMQSSLAASQQGFCYYDYAVHTCACAPQPHLPMSLNLPDLAASIHNPPVASGQSGASDPVLLEGTASPAS